MADERQITSHVVMIRPRGFGPNAETAQSNYFQRSVDLPPAEIRARAAAEFDAVVGALEETGVTPLVFEDTELPPKPDAIFPNNWISLHADGRVFIYPMASPARRAERRLDIVEALSREHAFRVAEIIDLSGWEKRGCFLEGTGSMVLDRVNRIAYAALSGRTHEPVLDDFARRAGYEVNVFDTADAAGRPVYHTNVMMGLGENFAVVCADAIADAGKRAGVLGRLTASGREVVEISVPQMEHFGGNLIELLDGAGHPLIVMSASAYKIMSNSQLDALARCGRVLPVSIDTIERVGGGSVRCMMAEVFLPR